MLSLLLNLITTDVVIHGLLMKSLTRSFMIANLARRRVGFGMKPALRMNLIYVVYRVMKIKTGYNIIFGSLEVFSANSKIA